MKVASGKRREIKMDSRGKAKALFFYSKKRCLMTPDSVHCFSIK